MEITLLFNENIKLLKIDTAQVKVILGNTEQVLEKTNQEFDLIFLDPPFNKNLLTPVIDKISKQKLLAVDGVIYIESEGQCIYSVPEDWQLIKEKRTSQVLVRLYQRN